MSGLITRYERNTAGRDLIVGDIHGHFTRLHRALDAVGFDPAKDRLFSVGDLVDRGPESEDCLDWLAKPWFFAVRGNHEEMAVDWANGLGDKRNYVANGGAWNVSNPRAHQRLFADTFEALPVALEIETDTGPVGVVHAGCPYSDWRKFTEALKTANKAEIDHLIMMATWSRERIQSMDDSMVSGVRAVVVGHTPMANVTSLGNTIFIDTAGWHPSGAGFTLLDVATLTATTVPNKPMREAA